MQLGMIGLGRMGANMIRRVMRAGHEGMVYDRDAGNVATIEKEGATGARDLDSFVDLLSKPRTAWLMVPSGHPTESVVTALGERFDDGDVIIDGGNSFFKDDLRRARALAKRGIHYLDVGTSGGVWGLERGYCLMIGGEPGPVRRVDPIFKALAPGRGDIERTPGRDRTEGTAEQGYLHCGPVGSGHFVKMIHNGIEYGVMQAYAEGFDILDSTRKPSTAAEWRYDLNLADIAEVWRRGSVIGSWLLDLVASALLEDSRLARYSGFVQDSGEGRWSVMTAVEQAVPAEVLSAALYTRFRSREESTYAEKVLSAMRYKFGGHVEPPTGE